MIFGENEGEQSDSYPTIQRDICIGKDLLEGTIEIEVRYERNSVGWKQCGNERERRENERERRENG